MGGIMLPRDTVAMQARRLQLLWMRTAHLAKKAQNVPLWKHQHICNPLRGYAGLRFPFSKLTERPNLPLARALSSEATQAQTPTFFLPLHLWVLSRGTGDEFEVEDFVKGAKHAFNFLNGKLFAGDTSGLDGLVSEQFLEVMAGTAAKVQELKELGLTPDSIDQRIEQTDILACRFFTKEDSGLAGVELDVQFISQIWDEGASSSLRRVDIVTFESNLRPLKWRIIGLA